MEGKEGKPELDQVRGAYDRPRGQAQSQAQSNSRPRASLLLDWAFYRKQDKGGGAAKQRKERRGLSHEQLLTRRPTVVVPGCEEGDELEPALPTRHDPFSVVWAAHDG